MPRLCLPTWHKRFASLSGHGRPKIMSGCGVSGGNVQCAPEKMRADAEAKLRSLGYWSRWRKLPLAAYTASRYVSSEVGSGTPEEKVAVIEAAMHQAQRSGMRDVNDLLLYRQAPTHPNYGWYGPIHSGCVTRDVTGRCTKRGAPYGRWASTRSEPGIDDILIANFVLSGQSGNFSQGADDQLGMEYIGDPAASVRKNALHRDYWVGPLVGVDHWHTFLFARREDVPPDSPQGQFLLARGLRAVANRQRPDWSGLPVCPSVPGPLIAVVALAAGLGIAYAAGTRIEPTWRGE